MQSSDNDGVPAMVEQTVAGTLARAWRSLRAVVAGVMGDDAYDRYVARHRAQHPDHEPMSAAEFWRQRDDDAEKNVQTGCC